MALQFLFNYCSFVPYKFPEVGICWFHPRGVIVQVPLSLLAEFRGWLRSGRPGFPGQCPPSSRRLSLHLPSCLWRMDSACMIACLVRYFHRGLQKCHIWTLPLLLYLWPRVLLQTEALPAQLFVATLRNNSERRQDKRLALPSHALVWEKWIVSLSFSKGSVSSFSFILLSLRMHMLLCMACCWLFGT